MQHVSQVQTAGTRMKTNSGLELIRLEAGSQQIVVVIATNAPRNSALALFTILGFRIMMSPYETHDAN